MILLKLLVQHFKTLLQLQALCLPLTQWLLKFLKKNLLAAECLQELQEWAAWAECLV